VGACPETPHSFGRSRVQKHPTDFAARRLAISQTSLTHHPPYRGDKLSRLGPPSNNSCWQARYRIFKAQESLKGPVYNCLAIWKAVVIGACLQGLWQCRTLWGGDFAALTGITRSGHSGLQSRVKFYSGEISPRQFVMSRTCWDGFPNRRDSISINWAS
jgi:hypothetical protein